MHKSLIKGSKFIANMDVSNVSVSPGGVVRTAKRLDIVKDRFYITEDQMEQLQDMFPEDHTIIVVNSGLVRFMKI